MKINEKIETEKLKLFNNISDNNEKIKKLGNLKQAVGKIVSLDVNEIKLNENVRKKINTDSDEFRDLKNSIASAGVLQPAVVELRELNDSNDYELVAVSGHRRILACKELGLEKIKAELKQYDDFAKRTEHALIENLMREDLHALDVAEGYVDLLENGWDENAISERFSKDKKYVKNILKVGQWPTQAKEIVREHPEKFSMRILCNKFSKRKWENDEELLSSLNEHCGISTDGERVPQKISNLKTRNKLNEFFATNKLSSKDKDLVEKALQYIGVKF